MANGLFGFIGPYLATPQTLVEAIENGLLGSNDPAVLAMLDQATQASGIKGVREDEFLATLKAMDRDTWKEIVAAMTLFHSVTLFNSPNNAKARAFSRLGARQSPPNYASWGASSQVVVKGVQRGGAVLSMGRTEGDPVGKKGMQEFSSAAEYFNRGLVLEKEGKVARAIEVYRQVFYVDPQATQKEVHVLTCLNMGKLYLLESNFDDAAYVLRHGVELDPNRADIRANYAVALLGLNKQLAAIRQYAIVLEMVSQTLEPKTAEIRKNTMETLEQLAEKAMEQNQFVIAIAALETLLKQDAQNKTYQDRKIEAEGRHRTTSKESAPRKFSKKDLAGLSKTVAHALRHTPWEYDLELDGEGWVDINRLVAALQWSPIWRYVTRKILEQMVQEVSSERFEIQENKIRALYGHSIPGKIKKVVAKPPLYLFHGTTREQLSHILKKGLQPQSRQYVHLSPTRDQALTVARRHKGDPVILVVRALEAFQSGIYFYPGGQKVWLSDSIPSSFFKED